MKTNEAPEKIYIDNFGSELSYDWHTEHCYESDIEYTRTNAFIEKAVSYLEGTLFNEVCYGEIRPDIVQTYINDFKKAMEK